MRSPLGRALALVAAAVLLAAVIFAVVSWRSRHSPSDDDVSDAVHSRYRRPDSILAALDLRPGDAVADIGAGRGFLTLRLAGAVGERGRVVATDIDEQALAALSRRAASSGVTNVTTRHVKPDDPGLEASAYDLILLAEVDHYLGDRAAYFRRLVPSLRTHGRIAVTNRLPYRQAVFDAARAASLCLLRETRDLPAHYLALFEAPPCQDHP